MQLGEQEQKHINIASFDANENEASMMYPILRVTDDVCYNSLHSNGDSMNEINVSVVFYISRLAPQMKPSCAF